MSQARPPIYINPSPNGNNSSSPMLNYYVTSAKGDGMIDAQPQLQADIDYCIANGITALFIPKGVYRIGRGLLIYKNNNTGGYGQVTLKIFGEASMWDSFETTVIQTNFTDQFAIGIQQGKGVTIDGLQIKGRLALPIVSDRVFYSQPLAACSDGICRQTRYSPNAGIAIDPLSNGQIPGDGGYPNWTSWYKGNNSVSGSTKTTITNCSISSFPVGIVSSPNGYTQNAEITRIEHVHFSYCPLWISGGQDQEKDNGIYDVAGWAETNMCFATNVYGAGSAGHWFIDGVNVAGRCKQIIQNDQQGRFPTYLNNVYAEGLGKVGYISAGNTCRVTNSLFNFVPVNISGYSEVMDVGNVKFDGCTFRYYGYTYPIFIKANKCVFASCYFSGIPVQVVEGSNPGWTSSYQDCIAAGYRMGVTGVVDKNISEAGTLLNYGDLKLAGTNSPALLTLSSTATHVRLATSSGNAPSVVQTNNSFSFSSALSAFYDVNDAVILSTSHQDRYYGLVTAISGNTITISYITEGMPDGVWGVFLVKPLTIFTFMGDITSGSNQITNVAVNWGVLYGQEGRMFQCPYSPTGWQKIVAVSGSTYTVSENMTTNKVGAYFNSGTTQQIYTSGNPLAAGNILVCKGDTIQQGDADNGTQYKVTLSGWLTPPSGDHRQATIAQLP
jgi:hypothetical protein